MKTLFVPLCVLALTLPACKGNGGDGSGSDTDDGTGTDGPSTADDTGTGTADDTGTDDGDPIDVLVANTRPVVPGCVMSCRPIGVLVMEDEKGQDEKIVAVPTPQISKRWEHVREFADLPEITREQIGHFFEHYKDLEPGKWVKVENWGDAARAREMIVEAIERAKL